jgi:hypothetical protein
MGAPQPLLLFEGSASTRLKTISKLLRRLMSVPDPCRRIPTKSTG